MSLEYQEILIDGYTNTTDKFGLLVGYNLTLGITLVSGPNYAVIYVLDILGNHVDEVGLDIKDNGLTPTYAQINTSSGNPKPLLIPPGYSLMTAVSNGYVDPYGMLLLGTLDEIARVAIR